MPQDHDQTSTPAASDESDAVQPEPDEAVAPEQSGAWTALAAPGKPDGEVDTRT